MRSVDIMTYLADCLMPKVDVASMAHGLEVRAPLLDPELITFGLRLPDRWLLRRNHGKRILVHLLRRYLPQLPFDGPKRGFTIPMRSWFCGTHRSRVLSLAHSDALLETGWFNGSGLSRLADAHLRGVRDYSQQLYNLLVLDEWLRQL
jgi:asparagine synthase (glutamine-hydrolysing)